MQPPLVGRGRTFGANWRALGHVCALLHTLMHVGALWHILAHVGVSARNLGRTLDKWAKNVRRNVRTNALNRSGACKRPGPRILHGRTGFVYSQIVIENL